VNILCKALNVKHCGVSHALRAFQILPSECKWPFWCGSLPLYICESNFCVVLTPFGVCQALLIVMLCLFELCLASNGVT